MDDQTKEVSLFMKVQFEEFSNESKNLKIYFNQVFTTQVKTTSSDNLGIFAKKK